jgi:hypothetical protein
MSDRPWEETNPPYQTHLNIRDFPWEELAKYEGQYIAYNWEGTSIVAAAPTRELLHERLKELGIDLGRVIFDFADPPH